MLRSFQGSGETERGKAIGDFPVGQNDEFAAYRCVAHLLILTERINEECMYIELPEPGNTNVITYGCAMITTSAFLKH